MMKTYTLLGALRTSSLVLSAILGGWMGLVLLLCVPLNAASPYLFSAVGTILLIALGIAAVGFLFGTLKSRIGNRIDAETMGMIQLSQGKLKATLTRIMVDAQKPLV